MAPEGGVLATIYAGKDAASGASCEESPEPARRPSGNLQARAGDGRARDVDRRSRSNHRETHFVCLDKAFDIERAFSRYAVGFREEITDWLDARRKRRRGKPQSAAFVANRVAFG
jgi:hypothetical protein